jgi:hypothetical protein
VICTLWCLWRVDAGDMVIMPVRTRKSRDKMLSFSKLISPLREISRPVQ